MVVHPIQLKLCVWGTSRWNPLDTIAPDSPMLVDSARAICESLVFRTGSESDPFWNDRAVQILTAILVLILLRFEGKHRSLNSLAEIISDPGMLASAADKLREAGGVPGRLGAQVKALFDPQHPAGLSKEGSGIISTCSKHLSFLDSELVAASVAESTFDPADLLAPGTTLFLQIPPDQLEAQRGLLRCWVSTLVRYIGARGDEKASEVLFLIDEASALGQLPSLEEILVRGRSAGVRLLLAYQSDSQIQAVFKEKPTLLYDNCTTQIYLGASSFETAERLSKQLGERSQTISTYGENESRSHSASSDSPASSQQSQGSNLNYSENARALMQPSEILTMSDNSIMVFQRGMCPILGRRLKYYSDPYFSPTAPRAASLLWWWVMVAAAVALALWAMAGL